MEETSKIINLLPSGANLIWHSRADAVEPLDKTNKKAIVTRMIISAAVTMGIIAGYILAVSKNNVDIKWLLIAVIALCGGYAAVSPIADAKKFIHILYAATDNAFYTIDGDKVHTTVEFSRINSAVLKEDEDGHVSLLCGKDALRQKASRRRSAALFKAVMPEDGFCTQYVMYAVENHKELKETVGKYIKIS